jgi:hypothetical protein
MSLPVIGQDPGPMARLEHVIAQPNTPSVVFQRLTDADNPETLREIAKAWGLPAGQFIEWFYTNHSALLDAAQRVRADQLVNDAVSIADEQSEVLKKDGTTFDPDVPRDRLRVDTRLKIAEKWDRSRYGNKDTGPSGGLTVLVDRSCGGTVAIQAGDAKVVITSEPQGRVLEQVPSRAMPAPEEVVI